jgi:hypothetical protein
MKYKQWYMLRYFYVFREVRAISTGHKQAWKYETVLYINNTDDGWHVYTWD